MEYLVFLAPMLAALPIAVAAAYIGHRWFKSRKGGVQLREEVAELRDQVDALREVQLETHERLDFTERMLTQVRDQARLAGEGEEPTVTRRSAP